MIGTVACTLVSYEGVVRNMTYRTPPITDCAIALEKRGFESMWLGEHTYLPVDSVCRYGKGSYSCGAEARDGYVPEFYKRVPDPYPSLAAAAARKRSGYASERASRWLASTTLRRRRSPRSTTCPAAGSSFGVGYGWNPLEMRNNGFTIADRRAVMREKIEAMKALWTQRPPMTAISFVHRELVVFQARAAAVSADPARRGAVGGESRRCRPHLG
jgi:alkanesulfonate monooxygenase SsuD/methylene tetrahydromethanopterin reductase-like flavin-dependent oxidoreductase (luciferase family)